MEREELSCVQISAPWRRPAAAQTFSVSSSLWWIMLPTTQLQIFVTVLCLSKVEDNKVDIKSSCTLMLMLLESEGILGVEGQEGTFIVPVICPNL